MLAKEIDKVKNYVYPKKEITEQNINECISKQSDSNIWHLLNAVFQDNKETTIKEIEKKFEGIPKTKITGEIRVVCALIENQLYKLLLVKTAKDTQEIKSIAKKMKWSPMHEAMLIKQTKTIPLEKLLQMQKKIIDIYESAIDDPKNLEASMLQKLL